MEGGVKVSDLCQRVGSRGSRNTKRAGFYWPPSVMVRHGTSTYKLTESCLCHATQNLSLGSHRPHTSLYKPCISLQSHSSNSFRQPVFASQTRKSQSQFSISQIKNNINDYYCYCYDFNEFRCTQESRSRKCWPWMVEDFPYFLFCNVCQFFICALLFSVLLNSLLLDIKLANTSSLDLYVSSTKIVSLLGLGLALILIENLKYSLTSLLVKLNSSFHSFSAFFISRL